MKKIPLEATVVDAYKFFFSNIISIIGTVWLPFLIFAAVAGAFVVNLVPHDWLIGHFEPPTDPAGFVRDHIGVIALAVPSLIITGLLTGAMIKVGILRLALGEAHGVTLIWFSLGARVWRMIAASFVLVFVWGVIEFAGVVVVGGVNAAFIAAHASTVVVALTNVVLVIAIIVAAIYILARLFFFLPAIIVAENKVGLSRAWDLGKGNVWRIVVVLLAVIIPVYMVTGFVIYATVIPTVFVQVINIQPDGPAKGLAFLKSLWPLLPVIVGIELIAGLFISGTILGAIGKAYKAVTAEDAAL